MNINPDCEFCNECQLFDPQFKRIYANDKIVDWRVHCYNRAICENAIRLFEQKQEKEAKRKDNACSDWFNFIDDSREKQ